MSACLLESIATAEETFQKEFQNIWWGLGGAGIVQHAIKGINTDIIILLDLALLASFRRILRKTRQKGREVY